MNEVLVDVRSFLLGGNAGFTLLQDGKNPISVKYRVVANENKSCYFIYTESKTSSKIVYQAYITSKDWVLHKAKQVEDSDYNERAIKAIDWLLKHCDNLPDIVHVYHNGRCSKCGRKLTDLESLRTGLGPVCRSKVK